MKAQVSPAFTLGDGNGNQILRPELTRRSLLADRRVMVLLGVLAALAAGGAIAIAPLMGAAAIVVVIGGCLLLTLGRGVATAYISALAIILVGYAFVGRSFAYVGLPPLYVGEAVLALGVLAFIVSPKRWLPGSHTLLLAFIGLGAVRTVPYVKIYGIDALRDAALWYYALTALFISALMGRKTLMELPGRYARLIPWFLIWLPIGFVAATALGPYLPVVPGSDVPIVSYKGGDVGVHLAGLTAFFTLGMYQYTPARLRRVPQPLLWALWFVPVGLVAASNRGGFLSLSLVVCCLMVFRPGTEWLRMGYILGIMVIALLIINPKFEYNGVRDVSVTQVVGNISSLFGSDDSVSQNSTRDWRLEWWGTIYDYTVHGPYFWEGKGFGVNLADSDGYQVMADHSLRSPHNSHMTVLARMGVPGLALWLLIQLTFGYRLLRAFFTARSRGKERWMQLNGWLFCYWLAMVVNSSFDVYLEGPQGGIWFWAVYGTGLAALAIQAREQEQEQRAPARAATPASALGATP